MDPVTAIQLASSILGFIDLGVKVVSSAAEAYGATSGLTAENRTAETVVVEMQKFAAKLQPSDNDSPQLTSEERALCRLAVECSGIAGEIVELVERSKPKQRKRKAAAALLTSLRSV